jgi:starvation-inducible DNA-binding protein
MNSRKSNGDARRSHGGTLTAEPKFPQEGELVQDFGQVLPMPIGLPEEVCSQSVTALNQILSDTMTLRDLYKKHHWQVAGPTFYQLHLLFDKHFGEQSEIVDSLAERIQLLGGISLAMAPDVAETTDIERPPRGREETPVQISRLLKAHETILRAARAMARACDDAGDLGTSDLLITEVVRKNELQVWFLAEHLVAVPEVEAR